MIQRGATHPGYVWLYTLEHPKVDNQIRLVVEVTKKMLRVC